MAERTQTNGGAMPPQMQEVSEELGAMHGLLTMMQQIQDIHDGFGAMLGLLEKIVHQTAPPKPPSQPVPVAGQAQLYPMLHPAAAVPREEPEAVEPCVEHRASSASCRIPAWGRAFPRREP